MTELSASLTILQQFYDTARIIDPEAISLQPVCKHADTPCSWDCCHTGTSSYTCKNCICLQAIEHQETFASVEMRQGKCFLITAIPVETNGHPAALELIKSISANAVATFLPGPEKSLAMYQSIAKLKDLTIKDALTNIYNRRYIDEHLPQEIVSAKQHSRPFSIIMADIDYFKQINDQYGHGVGDEVLKFFAAQLQNNLRPASGDWVARYGGEEFLIFLADCQQLYAYKIAERLRKRIAAAQIATSAGQLQITASFGVHTFSGEETALNQLFDKVDSQLYQAKQAGRNCTTAAGWHS